MLAQNSLVAVKDVLMMNTHLCEGMCAVGEGRKRENANIYEPICLNIETGSALG